MEDIENQTIGQSKTACFHRLKNLYMRYYFTHRFILLGFPELVSTIEIYFEWRLTK